MRKRFCLLLSVVVFVLLCATNALASISVTWENGILTVSTTDTRGMNVVYIDGKDTGTFVGDTSPSKTYSVPADGLTHKVTTTAYWGASGGSATFVAALPTKAPTAKPTEQPTDTPAPVEPTLVPADPTQAPDVTAVPADPTVAPDVTAAPADPTAAPDVTAAPADPTTAPDVTAAPAAPTPAPTAKPVPSVTVDPALISDRYGNILMSAKNKPVPYMIVPVKDNPKKLVIIAVNSDYETVTEIRMNLTGNVVDKIRKDGYTSIAYVNDVAILDFDLNGLRNTVFAENDATNGTYILTTDPYAENGCLVKVNGVTSEGKGIVAKQFAAMELVWNNRKMSVTENGIYTQEQFTDWVTAEEGL